MVLFNRCQQPSNFLKIPFYRRGVSTYNAYCIAPSFFSWLGKGTSRRTFPDAVKDDEESVCRSMAVAGIAAEREIHARCSSCLVIPIEWRDAAASEQETSYERVSGKTRKQTHGGYAQLERGGSFSRLWRIAIVQLPQTNSRERRHTSCISKAPKTSCWVGQLRYLGVERLKN